MSSKPEVQMATIVMEKMDDGNRAKALNSSSRGLWQEGDVIQNNNFLPFPKGTRLRVLVSISETGRKMVQSINGVPVSTKDTVASKVKSTPLVSLVAQPLDLTGYYIDNEARLTFNTLARMSAAKPDKPAKLMMVGPSGYGKTTIPELFAQAIGKKFYRMNCASIRDPEEWYGYREARDGSTVFVKSELIKCMEEGNVVVVLDELNRVEPWLHNTLFPLLDHAAKTTVHDQTFGVGSGVIVVGTINTGNRYTGTFQMDEALLNRFDMILEVGPLPYEEEVEVLVKRTGVEQDEAQVIVKVANIMRQTDVVCSTSTTLRIANMVCAGMDLRQAFESAVIRRVPRDQAGSTLRKELVDEINNHLGVLQVPSSLDNDVFGSQVNTFPVLVNDEPTIRVGLQRRNSDQIHNLTVYQSLVGLTVKGKNGSMTKLTQKSVASVLSQISGGIPVVLEFAEAEDVVRQVLVKLSTVGIHTTLL